MLTQQLACFCMYCYRKKRFFCKKFSKRPVTPTFFSVSLFSSTRSCEGVKKVGLLMFKIPDFSLAPRLCKQAGLDLNVCMKGSWSPYTCIGRPSPFLHDCTLCCALRWSHLKTLTMASMEIKVASRDSFLDNLSEKLYLNRFQGFWQGAKCAPPLGFWSTKKPGWDRVKGTDFLSYVGHVLRL